MFPATAARRVCGSHCRRWRWWRSSFFGDCLGWLRLRPPQLRENTNIGFGEIGCQPWLSPNSAPAIGVRLLLGGRARRTRLSRRTRVEHALAVGHLDRFCVRQVGPVLGLGAANDDDVSRLEGIPP